MPLSILPDYAITPLTTEVPPVPPPPQTHIAIAQARPFPTITLPAADPQQVRRLC